MKQRWARILLYAVLVDWYKCFMKIVCDWYTKNKSSGLCSGDHIKLYIFQELLHLINRKM